MVHQPQIFACIIRQYGTGLYRTCVSLAQNHSICLSTHSDEKSAIETIDQFRQFCESQKQDGIRTDDDLRRFIDSLRPPDPIEKFQLPAPIEGEIDLAP